jgi:hypothetical protein
MKREFKISKHINPEIKVGDKVKIFDGSALTCSDKPNAYIIIPNSYPEITGINEALMHIEGEVLDLNQNTVCSAPIESYYLQDATIRLGDAKFRTCTAFLIKINP